MRLSGEDFKAVADVVAEKGEVEAAKVGWQWVEAAEGVPEQARGAEGTAAALVFEGGGDLDDSLEQGLFGFGCGQPDQFPRLVGGEVLAGVVAAEAFGEFSLGPVEGHG